MSLRPCSDATHHKTKINWFKAYAVETSRLQGWIIALLLVSIADLVDLFSSQFERQLLRIESHCQLVLYALEHCRDDVLQVCRGILCNHHRRIRRTSSPLLRKVCADLWHPGDRSCRLLFVPPVRELPYRCVTQRGVGWGGQPSEDCDTLPYHPRKGIKHAQDRCH